MQDERWRIEGERLILNIRVIPNASRQQVEGFEPLADGRWVLKVRLTAVPEGGKANKALVALLAKIWKCSKSDIEILQGETSRLKRLAAPAAIAAYLDI